MKYEVCHIRYIPLVEAIPAGWADRVFDALGDGPFTWGDTLYSLVDPLSVLTYLNESSQDLIDEMSVAYKDHKPWRETEHTSPWEAFKDTMETLNVDNVLVDLG